MRRCLVAAAALLASVNVAHAQVPRTRVEEIELARRDKRARLWPERQSPLVDEVNGLVERGLYDSARTGKGANGPQLLLGGMRSGQGVTVGIGYRRSDLWHERLGMRATARGTLQKAFLLDFQVDFQGLRSERFFLDFYTKLESSPQMDFYGLGGESLEEDRTSYLYDDLSADFRLGFNFTDYFAAGFTLGALAVHTGTGQRGGFPSTDEIFDSETAPGLREDTTFSRWGGFLDFDYRDLATGPRSGGYYAALVRDYADEELDKFSFSQVVLQAQQYIPYFNKTRVIAIRVLAEMTFEDGGNDIPFYLQPKLGGNDNLRGFQRYRFHDDQALIVNVEHRWHASSALDMAVFVDAGKVAPDLADIDFTDLEWSAGFGFRFKLRDAYFMRIDFAGSREGFRFMWTFSDIFKTRWEVY